MSENCELLPSVKCCKSRDSSVESARVHEIGLIESAVQFLQLSYFLALPLSYLVLNVDQVRFVRVGQVFSFKVEGVQLVLFS